jgi:DNA repair exonuclease SbcCD ATPase subunit
MKREGSGMVGVSAIGQSTVVQTGQGSQNSQTEIRNLERQKEQIQQKINDLNQDKTVSSKEKQQEIQLYEVQMQTIDARIQQLEQSQIKVTTASKQQDDSTTSSQMKNVSSLTQKVDIEA